MSWLDRAISFISPKWGASRAAWRGAMEEIRNYDAGSFGRLNANWRVFNESAEQTDKNEREYVRAKRDRPRVPAAGKDIKDKHKQRARETVEKMVQGPEL